MRNPHDYGDYYFCGGEVVEKVIEAIDQSIKEGKVKRMVEVPILELALAS